MQRFLILAWTYICFTPNFVASGWLDAVQRSVDVNAGDLCFVSAERTTILNDRLYFEGGFHTFANGDIGAREKKLYWLDLNTSFPVDIIIPSSNALRSVSAQGSQAAIGGAFFTDALLTTLYGFSAPNSTIALDSVESFNTTTQQWANQSVSGGSFNGIGRGGSDFATTSTSGLGLGFYITNGLNAKGPPGLITFDASNPSALTWTWKTGGAPNVDSTALKYARYGNKGVLIAFGGYRDIFAADLYNMSEIFIYDIDSQTWFNVTADGDVPGPRSEFCSIISAASDDSGFFITIYGGYNIHGGRAYEEVYILEVPRFSWVNMTSVVTDNVELKLSPTAGRYGHRCELYGERQMIVLGGNIITQGGSVVVNSLTCDTKYPPIRLLDISTFQWQARFTPGSAPYTIPPRVAQDVGGGPQGQVKNVSPTGGFNNSGLTKIFNKTIPRIAVSSISASSATNSTNGQNPLSTPSGPVPSASSSTPIGAIVGGVVGGILAVAIVGALLYFFCYRRRRRSQEQRNEREEAMGQFGTPETSSQSPVATSPNDVHEMHANNRAHEIDSNGFVEAPAAHALARSPYFEMPSNNER